MTPVPTPPTLVRRLLTVALLACALVALGPTAAQAEPGCSCRRADARPDLEELARSANLVFTGEVGATRTERVAGDPGRKVHTHEVALDLVFKGRPEGPVVAVTTTSGGRCDLGPLEEGRPYVFLVRAGAEALKAAGCSGTRPARAAVLAELEKLYGPGEAPRSEQPAEPLTIERVPGAGAPPSLTRAAAPGLAMVLVGLLGLVVVGRLGRRA